MDEGSAARQAEKKGGEKKETGKICIKKEDREEKKQPIALSCDETQSLRCLTVLSSRERERERERETRREIKKRKKIPASPVMQKKRFCEVLPRQQDRL